MTDDELIKAHRKAAPWLSDEWEASVRELLRTRTAPRFRRTLHLLLEERARIGDEANPTDL